MAVLEAWAFAKPVLISDHCNLPEGVPAGAAIHFLLSRFTDYPHGTFKWIPFRTHAFIELAEGIVLVVATTRFLPPHGLAAGTFLVLMGLSQIGAFAFSNYDKIAAP